MSRIYVYLLAVFTVFTLACSKKDIGNYSYHDINEIKFSTELNGTITGFVLKNLKIEPELSFTMDTEGDPNRYTYQWAYIVPTSQTNPGLRTIATTKDLDMIVNIAPGTYPAMYRVTDSQTGVHFTKKFLLDIRNVYNEGWLMMTDVNGQAQLDFLSKQPDGSFLPINDLLKQSGSDLKLKGKPKVVYSYETGKHNGYGINLPYGLYVGTDQSTDRLDGETFAWDPKYNIRREILDPDIPENFHIDVIQQVRGSDNAYFISSVGNLYFTAPAQNIKYGQPFNFDTDHLFRMAPFIACSENFVVANLPAYFYDMDNRRFCKHQSSFENKVSKILDPSNDLKLFSYENTGKDMLYMTFVAKGIEVNALLQDLVNKKVYLARFDALNTRQKYYDEVVSTDIQKGESFAVSPDQGFVYYSVGGKLYQYDYSTTPSTSKLVKDYGTSKISLIKFQTYQNANKYPDGGKLMVCSYDPALPEGQNGRLDKYSVLLGASGISLDETYSGFGKVVSLNYRQRK